MPTRFGNNAQSRAESIQAAKFCFLMTHGIGEEENVEPGVFQAIKSPCRYKPSGMVTLWDTLMARYHQAPDRMRATVAGLLLMAGADADSIREGVDV